MKDFDYLAPESLAEAIDALANAGGRAHCLAGGTDLIDHIRSGQVEPTLVIDVKKIPELTRLKLDEEGIHIGAAATCTQIINFDPVKKHIPILIECCSILGDIKIQNRASAGGNLCNAAPSADAASPLLVLDSVAVIAGSGGSRQPQRFLVPGDELEIEWSGVGTLRNKVAQS